MSATSDDAAYVQLVSSVHTDNLLDVGVIALFVYEYIITFKQEVGLFWMCKKSGASWFFLTTRDLALLEYVFIFATMFAPRSDESCSMLQKAGLPIKFSQYLPWAAFSGLRTLALSNLNWTLAAAAFILGCGPFAVNLWAVTLYGIHVTNVPPTGCSASLNLTPTNAIIGTAVSRGCIIASDILVLAVTVRYTVKNGRTRRVGTIPTLSNVLIVNGVIYFVVLATMNVLQITLTLLSLLDGLDSISYITIFTEPISAILICRFLIDLQSTQQRALDPDFSFSGILLAADSSNVGSLRFASRVIGPIGGPVGVAPDRDVREDEDKEDWGEEEGVLT